MAVEMQHAHCVQTATSALRGMRGIAGDFLVLRKRFGKGPVITISYRTGWKIPRNPPHPPH